MVKSENRDRDGEMKSLNWWEKQFLVGRLLHEASCPGMGAGTGGRGEIIHNVLRSVSAFITLEVIFA